MHTTELDTFRTLLHSMNPKSLLQSFVWWKLLIGSLLWIVIYALVISEVFGFSLVVSLVDSLLTNSILFFSLLAVSNTLRYYQPGSDRLMFLFSVAGGLTILVVMIERFLAAELLGFGDWSPMSTPQLYFHGSYALIGHVVTIGLSLQWNQLKTQADLQRRSKETENMAKEAELIKLRHQLQPHFLFNSLNSINALIGSRPDEARKMVHSLSDFLRGTIRQEEGELKTLAEELSYIQLYLEIEKVRFGHRLKTQLEIEEVANGCSMPPLLLQPLTENAIKYGLYGTVDDVEIELKSFIDQGDLIISISNPKDKDVSGKKGTGFGLKSVQRRLQLIYGRNDLLKIEETDSTFKVTVKIPQNHV